MNDTIKMPNGGYDIKVVRKEEVIECINNNIIDKEVMLAFINQFEVDATNFLEQGRWTSLPYMGTLRLSKYKEIMSSDEIKELDKEAKESLDKNRYILFRKNLRVDIAKRIKRDRVFRYILSQMVNKNKSFYHYLIETRGNKIAEFVLFTLFDINTEEHYELQTFNR